MAEAKSRRDAPSSGRPRARSKPEQPVNGEDELQDIREAQKAAASGSDGDQFVGYDDEVNNRYEEIKRGGTHIGELQQMTMPQLLKVAKDESLTDYTGLKKQDLIFQDPEGTRQAERADVRRRYAGSPSGRVRIPSQSGLQLSALPGRHLHFAKPDSAVRPADRVRRGRADPTAQGERALFRIVARRGDQLQRPRHSHAEGRLR